jgi:hypothetical protein
MIQVEVILSWPISGFVPWLVLLFGPWLLQGRTRAAIPSLIVDFFGFVAGGWITGIMFVLGLFYGWTHGLDPVNFPW